MNFPPWKDVVQIGFSIIVALWLLGRLDSTVNRIAEGLANHERYAAESRAAIVPLLRQQIDMLRTVCRHQARSETQMLECNQ